MSPGRSLSGAAGIDAQGDHRRLVARPAQLAVGAATRSLADRIALAFFDQRGVRVRCPPPG